MAITIYGLNLIHVTLPARHQRLDLGGVGHNYIWPQLYVASSKCATLPARHQRLDLGGVAEDEHRRPAQQHRGAARTRLGSSVALFLATFRCTPTANAEGVDRIGGVASEGLGKTRL